MVEAAGVERFFHSLDSITYLFSSAYKTAERPKMPLSWYSFGTVFGVKTPAEYPPSPAITKPLWIQLKIPPMLAYGRTPAASTPLFSIG